MTNVVDGSDVVECQVAKRACPIHENTARRIAAGATTAGGSDVFDRQSIRWACTTGRDENSRRIGGCGRNNCVHRRITAAAGAIERESLIHIDVFYVIAGQDVYCATSGDEIHTFLN